MGSKPTILNSSCPDCVKATPDILNSWFAARSVVGDYESMLVEHIEVAKIKSILLQCIVCRITTQ